MYKVPAKGESETDFGERELYNRSNAFWASRGVEGLLADVTDQEEKNGLIKQIEGIKASYNKLSETYQASKGNAGIPLD